MTTSDDWLAAQDPVWLRDSEDLHEFVTWAVENVDLAAAGEISGRIDVDRRRLIYLWHGSSPVQAGLRARGRATRIEVDFVPCPFSMDQYRAAVDRIFATAGDERWRGFVVSSIAGPTEDFTGMTIDGYRPTNPPAVGTGWHVLRPWAPLPPVLACPPPLIDELEMFASAVAGLPMRVVAAVPTE